jgi:hypothetical protein
MDRYPVRIWWSEEDDTSLTSADTAAWGMLVARSGTPRAGERECSMDSLCPEDGITLDRVSPIGINRQIPDRLPAAARSYLVINGKSGGIGSFIAQSSGCSAIHARMASRAAAIPSLLLFAAS